MKNELKEIENNFVNNDIINLIDKGFKELANKNKQEKKFVIIEDAKRKKVDIKISHHQSKYELVNNKNFKDTLKTYKDKHYTINIIYTIN